MSDLIALAINPKDIPNGENVPQIKRALDWLLKQQLDPSSKTTMNEMISIIFGYIGKKDLEKEPEIKLRIKDFLYDLAQGTNATKFLNKRDTWANISKPIQGTIINALTGETVDDSFGCRSLRLNVQTIIFICFFLLSVVYPVILCSYIFTLGEDKRYINIDKSWGPGGSCIELRNGLVGTSIAVNGIITIIVLIYIGLSIIGKNTINGKTEKVGFDYFRNLYVPENFLKIPSSKNFDTIIIINIFIFLSILSNLGLYLWFFNFIKDDNATNPWYSASMSISVLNLLFFILWAYCIFYHYKVQLLGPEGFKGR